MKRFDILYVPSIKSLGDKLKRFIVSNNQLLKQFYKFTSENYKLHG